MTAAKSQCRQIADFLKTGAKLTPLDALRMWGVGRCAARVETLRKQGLNIVTNMITVEGAHGVARVAEYSLAGGKA